MNKTDRVRLLKICDYTHIIMSSVDRYGKSFDVFSEDIDFQQSVSFSILQISELANGLSESFRNETLSEMNWHQIRGMRNIIAHGYGSVRMADLWETVIADIPALSEFCQKQLKKEEKSEE